MEEHVTPTDDATATRLIARKWREETEPVATRPNRYNTAKIAAFGWHVGIDRYAEWSRHR